MCPLLQHYTSSQQNPLDQTTIKLNTNLFLSPSIWLQLCFTWAHIYVYTKSSIEFVRIYLYA